jgi:predicted phage baseplate assembly protein
VEFGDGIDGMIPPRGVNNIHVTYRSGGGTAGNVGAGAIDLASSVLGIDGAQQREPASGGTDPEDIDVAKANAPSRLRALERAVTAADFETLALERAGAARATALNRYHPLYPAAPVTAALTLVVVPPRTGEDPAPTPTQGFLDSVSRALEPYRVLTTELFVVAPTYHDILVAADVDVALETDAPTVRTKIGDALRKFFDPIVGGKDGRGWPLGGTIFYGEVMSEVLKVDRVVAVRSLTLTLDGRAGARCADVTLSERTALLRSGAHQVTCNLAGTP